MQLWWSNSKCLFVETTSLVRLKMSERKWLRSLERVYRYFLNTRHRAPGILFIGVWYPHVGISSVAFPPWHFLRDKACYGANIMPWNFNKIRRSIKEMLSPKQQKRKAIVKYLFCILKCIKRFFNRGRLVYIFISSGR